MIGGRDPQSSMMPPPPTIRYKFLSDGTYSDSGWPGKWQRLDDSHLKMLLDAYEDLIRRGRAQGAPEIVTVTIEGNIATFTDSKGRVTKCERQGLW